MKNFLYILLISLFTLSCNNDDKDPGCVSRDLPNYGFDTGSTINTNLTQYISLTVPSSTVYLSSYGVKGIYVHNNGTSIVAFEASDPAHGPSSCSAMTRNGIELSCSCGDGNKYLLLTGQQSAGQGGHCLRAYNVDQIGNIIRVYN